MAIVAHSHPFVIGVDTHARTHTLAVVSAPGGAHVAAAQFPATAPGHARALAWAARRTGADQGVLWVVEGVGSYGAGLARTVAGAGYRVVEAPRMDARARRGVGKSDPLDAARIAAAALPLDTTKLRDPRTGTGPRAALRVLAGAREQMTTERTRALNALNALARTVDLGTDARRALTATQVATISRWRERDEDLHTATARTEARRLATRIGELGTQIRENLDRTRALLAATPAAPLLEHTGIGPVTAATVLVAWSHPGRIRTEAAFAALAGVAPLPASSGNTTRHRLNRGGDRRLNRALHMATITRMVHDPETRTYVERRRAQGHTTKEIRRCLKRYLARRLYRQLNTLHTT